MLFQPSGGGEQFVFWDYAIVLAVRIEHGDIVIGQARVGGGSKVTAVGDHEITYAFTNKAKKTVEKTRHFDSLVIATGMHSRPTQDLTDACSELGIPCDVIGSARKADMGIEATAEAYAAAMKV